MIGAVGEGAPGVILHAPRAFACDPIGVCAADAGVLDRFVRIDRNTIFRRCFADFPIMLPLPLAVVPLHRARPARVPPRTDPSPVGSTAVLVISRARTHVSSGT